VIQYRSFLNTSPPLIEEIWRQQPPIRGQVESLTRATLDAQIFSKPYFESGGLIIAIDESGDQPVPLGFVHAGFAPNDDLSRLFILGCMEEVKFLASLQKIRLR